jgi:deoxyribose-phosphate aldolase
LCKICTDLNVAYVKTSTGYGFVKQPGGDYNYKGATEHQVKLMRQHCAPYIRIKAAGGIRTLDDVLKFHALGCSRIGLSATESILEEAKKRGLARISQ